MATVPQSQRRGRARAEIIPQGTRFGKLTIVSGPHRQPPPAPAIYFYTCQCDCGRQCEVQRKNLVRGNTGSCGCAWRAKATTHGETGTRLHNIRAMMLQRCYNPNYNQYEDYGGRGISVCSEWRADYVPFRDWALANGYRDDLELDRKNNNGPYCPENCRFVTRAVQARNKRSNRIFTAYGETKCVTDWANDPRSKVSPQALNQRLKLGWDFERALTTPPEPRRRWKRHAAS